MYKFLRAELMLILSTIMISISVFSQTPVDWSDDTGILTFKEASVVYEGNFSCGVDVTTGNQAECDLTSNVEIPVNAGETYKISFWYFTSEHVRIRAALDWDAGSATYSTNYGGPTSTGDWEQFTYEGTVPDNVTLVFLRLRFYDIGSFVPPETQYIDLVEFESPVGTPLSVANGGFEQWPSLNPEPTNYPTGFTAMANNLTIQLDWTDAIGAQLPDAYLIKASDDDNIDPPTDGDFMIDDLVLEDGEGAANIPFGVQTVSFTNLPQQTTYYFKIFSYTNSGPNVDYKTDGTPPVAEATTAAVVTLNQEDFNEGWGEWITISVIGDQVWDRNNSFGINGTPCAQMSGYAGGSLENEDWLISPALDFTQNENEVFSFYSAMGYPTATTQLTVKISTDYDGISDPNTATWDDLNPILASGSPYWEWTFSGSMNVSGYESDNVHLAFKYTSPDTESETWEIDDILVTAGGGTTPVITVISPAAGAIWIQENSYDILWSAFSTQTNVSIEVTENASSGTPSWTQLGTALATAGAWTWNITLSQTPGNDYKIRISDFTADVTGESGIFSVIEPVYVPSLVITEIMYNPPESGTDSLEFIEIYNNDAIGVDMTDYSFANGVVFVFPSLTLQPAEFLLVAVNSAAMQNTFGVDALQWTGGALSNNGELIELQDKYGNTVDYVLYDDVLPWDTLADGWGPSLTFCDPSLDNSIPENWTTSIHLAAINAAGDSIWATPEAGCASPEPVADFEADNTSIQAGQSVIFTDLSTGSPDTWQWTFEGGTPATYTGQTPPAITYNNQGTFDVSLTVTNQSGSSTETKVDYIQVFPTPPPPSANFTANVTIINVGQSVNFTDLSTNTPTSWEWTFEEGSPGTSTAQNPSGIVYNTAGTFDVTLTATNQYGSDTETKLDFITVQVIPPPQAAFGADATTIYVGESVVFTDQSTGGPTTWAWTFESGNPASSNQQNPPAISYNATGVYDVSLTVSNTNGSTTETKTDYINVIAVPTYDLVITEIMYNPPEAGDDFLEFIEIYNNSDDPANLGGLYFSAGIEFDFPAEVLQAGEYFLVAKDAAAFLTAFGVEAEQWTSGALSNSGELVEIMDVGSNIVDHVDYSDMAPWPVEPDGEGPSLTLCDPDIDNNNGENWYASVHYAGLNPAGDSLFATPGGPCQITAVDDLPNLQEISVFPNPSHGKFVVELPSHLEWNLEIYNLTGSIVFSTNSSDNRITVDVNHLKRGIYLLKAINYSGNNILSKKIIIE